MKYEGIQRKLDGTFVINFNGMPFHVTPDYPPVELYGEEMTHRAIAAYADKYPEEVTEYAEPVLKTPEVTEEEKKALRIYELGREAQSLAPAIEAGIDVDYNRQKLVDCLLEIEALKGNI